MPDIFAIGSVRPPEREGADRGRRLRRATAVGLAAVLAGSAGSAGSPLEAVRLETDRTHYGPDEAIRVTLTNAGDSAISCPAAPDACAVVRFERKQDGTRSRWSGCERLPEVDRPFTIEPGGVLEGSLRREPALRRSGVERYEGPLPKVDKPDETERAKRVLVKRDVLRLSGAARCSVFIQTTGHSAGRPLRAGFLAVRQRAGQTRIRTFGRRHSKLRTPNCDRADAGPLWAERSENHQGAGVRLGRGLQ